MLKMFQAMHKRKYVMLLILVYAFFSIQIVSAITYPTKTIYFSNLSETNATEYRPGSPAGNIFSVTGIIVNNLVYIRAIDLSIGLGIDYYTQNFGGTIQLSLEGNGSPRVFFYNDSNVYGVSRYYSVANQINVITKNNYKMTDGTVTQSTNHTFLYQSSNGVPFITYNGYYYVPAKVASLTLGALLYYETSSSDTIYDYRVNNVNYCNFDTNEYLVGGNWLSTWSTEGNDYLAPHFKINEFWAQNPPNSYYQYQLKVSVKQLSAAELVRHYYRNDQSLGIDPGFRGWTQNYNTQGSLKLSWHTRGRAWDSDGAPTTLQTAVWNDMRVDNNGILQTLPVHVSGSVYRTRKTTMKEISFGTEIEYGVSWLHLQSDPLNTQTSHQELP